MLFGLLALIAAAAFTGAAFYVNAVAQPARLTLREDALLTEWKPSYKRATVMQVALIALSAVFALAACAWLESIGWIAGALLMLGNIPVTFALIMPVNRRLMTTEPANAGSESRALVERWGRLHALRTALGAGAVLAYLAAALA